ncbi:MAG: DUF4402 domain-containing protein [Parasphingorhabdus sp.]
MNNSRYKRAIVCVPAAFIAIQGAHAANDGGDSTANIRQPVSVTKAADLDFGTFVPGTANSVFRINPRNGNMTQRSGDAIAFGGTPTPASFDVTGTAGLRVQITRNQNRIFITRDGGTETMRINRFTYDRRRKRLNAAGEANFAVGGQIRIGGNQAAGTYRGTFGVTVEYQ